MSDLTEKFADLETQLAGQAATIAGYIDTVEDKLQSVLDNLDTIILNNAANTKYLLAAIGQFNACAPCPTPSITVPPTDDTSNPVNSDRCKRVQALLHTIQTVLASFDDLMGLDVVGAWTLISDVYSQTFATLGSSDTIPLPSFPEAVNLAGDYFSFAAGRLFSGETASGNFAPLLLDLRDAMYVTGSAEAAQSAYNAVIDSASFSNEGKLLLKAAGYNELFSYFLDPSTEPDLTGYDGSACAVPPGTCYTVPSRTTPYGHTSSAWASASPPLPEAGGGDLQYATPMGAISGYVLHTTSPSGVSLTYWINEPGGGHSTGAAPDGWIVHTHDDSYSLELFYPPNVAFEFTLCPPE